MLATCRHVSPRIAPALIQRPLQCAPEKRLPPHLREAFFHAAQRLHTLPQGSKGDSLSALSLLSPRARSLSRALLSAALGPRGGYQRQATPRQDRAGGCMNKFTGFQKKNGGGAGLSPALRPQRRPSWRSRGSRGLRGVRNGAKIGREDAIILGVFWAQRSGLKLSLSVSDTNRIGARQQCRRPYGKSISWQAKGYAPP
jgi:hypothetical protein